MATKEDIDLSKAANLEAMKKVDKQFAETIKESSKTRKSKFNFAEPELIPLPSRGLLYKSVTDDPDILNGCIKLLPMTLKEEEILSTQKFIKTGSSLRMVLQSCIASDIDAKDILVFDNNYLLFRLRQISYGDEYTFKIKCNNDYCGKEFEHTIKISELKFNTLPDDVVEPIEVKLPRSKYTVKLIYPRLVHSEEIFMRDAGREKKSDDRNLTQLDNLIVTTISILDPSGKEVPPRDWEDFYESLVGVDRATLTDSIKLDTGVDTLKDVNCPYCGKSYDGTIPIGAEFFRI
jgi:hypothetical protein